MYDTMTPWHHDTMTPWHHDTMTQWHNDTMTPWHNDTMTQWQNDPMTQWPNDSMTQWLHDTMLAHGWALAVTYRMVTVFINIAVVIARMISGIYNMYILYIIYRDVGGMFIFLSDLCHVISLYNYLFLFGNCNKSQWSHYQQIQSKCNNLWKMHY